MDPYETLQRPELPLTVHEYDEYGNPNDPQAIKNIQSYSPCSNVQGGHRPAMFLSTGLQDTRVGPWEAFKWTGMMRDLSPTVCRQSVILQVTPDCGHNGPSDIMEDNLIKAAEIVFLEKSILKSNSMTGTALKKGSGG